MWGWTELAMTVAKETGVTYFQVYELPVMHVFTIATYLKEKTRQIQAEYNIK